jgi:DTW domain-containing protein YfiP
LPAPAIAVDRLRNPGRPDRLATLEAVALALGILEGPAVRDALMRVYRIMTERTLWTNGRVSAAGVTGGIPAGVRSHDPLKLG